MRNVPGQFRYEKPCTVQGKQGLNPVPCSKIVYENVCVCHKQGLNKISMRRLDNGKEARLRSIIELMLLSVSFDTELIVFTDDPAYVKQVDHLARFIATVDENTKVDLDLQKYMKVSEAAFDEQIAAVRDLQSSRNYPH